MDGVRIERIDPDRHDWSDFGCGDPAVDGWLQQDGAAAARHAGVVVQVATDGGRVVGCYRLGSFQVQARRPVTPLAASGSDLQRMPMSAVVVSRLGVDQRWQGRGLGTLLLWHALDLAAAIGPVLRTRLVVAHAATGPALGFVSGFGFRAFDSDPRWSYLPMQDVEATVSASAASPHSTSVMERPAPGRCARPARALREVSDAGR